MPTSLIQSNFAKLKHHIISEQNITISKISNNKMKIKKLSMYLLFILVALYANGKEKEDSLSYYRTSEQFQLNKLILPTSFILIGSWGLCNGWLQSVNHTVQNNMTELRNEKFFHADDYIQYLPVASNLGLEFFGAKARHSLKERLIITTTSYLAMGIMVNGIKLTIHEKRPDSSARNSFPSGHTATAFMGAELVRMEYSTGYAVGAYVIASGVAFLRLYNNRHWFNDILAGAGIGILSARIGYWLLPLNKKLFRFNKKEAPIIATCPFYDYQSKTLGGALSIRF